MLGQGICPLMSDSKDKVPCMKEACEWWKPYLMSTKGECAMMNKKG